MSEQINFFFDFSCHVCELRYVMRSVEQYSGVVIQSQSVLSVVTDWVGDALNN